VRKHFTMLAVAATAFVGLIGGATTAQAAVDDKTPTTTKLTAAPTVVQQGATGRAKDATATLTAVVRNKPSGDSITSPAVTYQVTSSGATVDSTTGKVTFNGTTCQATFQALYAGDTTYAGSSDTVTVKIVGGQDCPRSTSSGGKVTIQPVAKRYKTCADARADYPAGISKTAHPAVYAVNRHLDADRDGVACEIEGRRRAPRPAADKPVPCDGKADCGTPCDKPECTVTPVPCDGKADCGTPCDKPECTDKPTGTGIPTVTATTTAPGDVTTVEKVEKNTVEKNTVVWAVQRPVVVSAPATGTGSPAFTG
jgi:hypothetical protein